MKSYIDSALINYLRAEFQLNWHGIHGAPHWARVRRNGLALAATTGANIKVVEYFAFIHDVCRENDGYDPHHGSRAAKLARRIAGKLIHLREHELDLLTTACQGHSDGYIEEDITVQTCWDADRLDLPRVGVDPDPARLCTGAARKLLSHDDFRDRWAQDSQKVNKRLRHAKTGTRSDS
jgi:uncharacterized protein